jgi:transcriptional regulator with XRE-family HTH domain
MSFHREEIPDGKYPRRKPAYLTEKLVHIRAALGLSQNGLVRHLGLTAELGRETISGYEIGTIEPPLPVLLAYARAANVYVDALIDDELDLPLKLPGVKKSEGVKRSTASRSRKTVGHK